MYLFAILGTYKGGKSIVLLPLWEQCPQLCGHSCMKEIHTCMKNSNFHCLASFSNAGGKGVYLVLLEHFYLILIRMIFKRPRSFRFPA